ncbi:MAG TPA: hypothetical protein VKF38_04620 [Anaerolineaceae bacterium]|nr:hypothetical protein [Anaerolineaceae bacterium]
MKRFDLTAARPLWVAIVRWAIIFFIGLSIYTLILINRQPIFLRPLSIAIRYSFTFVLPLVFIGIYLAYIIPGWPGKIISFTATLSLFSLALAGLWTSGHSEQYVIASLMPWVDAFYYYTGALSVLDGGLFNGQAARRPFGTTFLVTLLGITGQNLEITLALLVVMTAVGCYFAARQVQNSLGAVAGTTVLVLLFFYYRSYSGTTMTESLGLISGAIGFVFLWRAAVEKNRTLAMLGLFITTVGMNARAGAFIELPALIAWGAWAFRKQGFLSWPSLLLGVAVVGAGFVINTWMFNLFAAPGSGANASFAYLFYGTAFGGKGWSQYSFDHPEVLNLPEQEQYRVLMAISLAHIRNDPLDLVRGVIHQYSFVFSIGNWSLYSYLVGDNKIVVLISRLIVTVLAIVGLIRCIIQRRQPLYALMLAAMIGVLLSVPGAPPGDDEGIRVYAVSIPFIVSLPAIGAGYILQKIHIKAILDPTNDPVPANLVIGSAIVVLFMTILAPLYYKAASRPPQYSSVSCPVGQDAVYMRFNPGSSINIIRESVLKLDWLPDFHESRFIWYIHNLPQNEVITELQKLQAPLTILSGDELKTDQGVWIFVDSNIIPDKNGIVGACGNWDITTDIAAARFFKASSMQLVSFNK